MTEVSKKMVIVSMVASGVVALTVLLDLILGVPFDRNFLMDFLFLIGAGLVIYMGYDAYQDLS